MPQLRFLTKLATLSTLLVVSKTAFAGTTPPTTTYTMTPSSPDGDNGWYVTPVRIDLKATDLNSGVAKINYKIDGGSWQTISFSDTLNLAQNPSMETAGATSSGVQLWEATVEDADTAYSQDPVNFAPNYASSSAKIVTTDASGTWHGINNETSFAVAYAYENMTASAWVKTQDITGDAYFRVYSLADDGFGGTIKTLISSSPAITGTNDWTLLSKSFSALPESVTGIYIDIGFEGSGTLWVDAVTINSSSLEAQTTVTIAQDLEGHTFEYYAEDTAKNEEYHSCVDPKYNCIEFDLDTTPPGNWNNSGAFRGIFGSDHELYVYTNVEDETSGLSTFTDKYQYKVDTESVFGRYQDLLHCNTPWQEDTWTILISPPFFPGVKSAYMLTPKTDFCNSNWKICKTVKFYAKDLAGNTSTKNFCINGPWIRVRGEGIVRANGWIDMVAEPEGDNTDGLIEVGGNTIDFFTSSRDLYVKNSSTPAIYTYDDYWNLTDATKTELTGDLLSQDGIFYYSGDYTIENKTVPNSYDDTPFSQVVFIDGDLYIEDPVEVDNDAAALFIVSGDVNIQKKVDTIGIGIIGDGTVYTAYDISEGESTGTLEFNGLLHGDTIQLQRTLQGTNNDDTPSEDFVYEPKYLVKLREFFGRNNVSWISVE